MGLVTVDSLSTCLNLPVSVSAWNALSGHRHVQARNILTLLIAVASLAEIIHMEHIRRRGAGKIVIAEKETHIHRSGNHREAGRLRMERVCSHITFHVRHDLIDVGFLRIAERGNVITICTGLTATRSSFEQDSSFILAPKGSQKEVFGS